MAEAADSPGVSPTAGRGCTTDEPAEEQVEGRLVKAKAAVIEVTGKAKATAVELKDKAVRILSDPQFQTCTIATAGGTVTIGAVGGAFGLAVGTASGSAAGLVPAIFTFGLSIPVGGAIGGGVGLCAGAATGSGVGAVAGYEAYRYRVEIGDGVVYVKTLAQDTAKQGKTKTLALVDCTKSKASEAVNVARTRADELAQRVLTCTGKAASCAREKVGIAADFATGTKTGVTCSAAAVGAVVGCVGGGASGSVAGGVAGLAPALFTFGLSIPIGAAVGMCLGAAAGGTAGAAGGGSLGLGGFTYRKEIAECAQGTCARVRQAADCVKERLRGAPPSAKADSTGQPKGPGPVAGA
uniref:Uncharacterized protein n=1 Tax=Alexandrium monilatum TaxID=311494 RepID=A0A7S4QA81_9DINO|mmetsp:Transcript_35660/g.110720  ORF Transcript_35660/g.110720 Transcript_35660/m.110720 type:complete len:353 (+) Transcript_35660:96-1154(+)